MTNEQARNLNPGDPVYQPFVNLDCDPVSWQVNRHVFVRLFGLSLIVDNPHQGEHGILVSSAWATKSEALGWIADRVDHQKELLSEAQGKLFEEYYAAEAGEGKP